MKFLILAALVAVCHAAPQNFIYSTPLNWAGYPYAYSAFRAFPYAAAPVVAPVAVPAIAASKYHAQDVLGQASFGHVEPFQTRAEARDLNGNVRGSYSYVDPNGKVNVVEYTAGHGGFRVLGANNLPEAPIVPEAPKLEAPLPVEDTPEVKAARAEFSRLYAEAASAAAAGVVPVVPAAAPVEEKAPAVEVSRRRRDVVLSYAAHPYVSSVVAPVLPAVAKTTFKVNQFEPVDAAVPASTRKLELKEKEHEIYTPLAYSAVVPAVHAVHPTVKFVAAEEKSPVEVKTVKTIASPLVYNYGFPSYYPYYL